MSIVGIAISAEFVLVLVDAEAPDGMVFAFVVADSEVVVPLLLLLLLICCRSGKC